MRITSYFPCWLLYYLCYPCNFCMKLNFRKKKTKEKFFIISLENDQRFPKLYLSCFSIFLCFRTLPCHHHSRMITFPRQLFWLPIHSEGIKYTILPSPGFMFNSPADFWQNFAILIVIASYQFSLSFLAYLFTHTTSTVLQYYWPWQSWSLPKHLSQNDSITYPILWALLT